MEVLEKAGENDLHLLVHDPEEEQEQDWCYDIIKPSRIGFWASWLADSYYTYEQVLEGYSYYCVIQPHESMKIDPEVIERQSRKNKVVRISTEE